MSALSPDRMYNLRVIQWWRENSSRRRSAMILAFFAFLLPCVLFSILQYGSLKSLERKTRIEAQDNLRQTLQGVSQRAKSSLENLAVEAMGRLRGADIEAEQLEDIEGHLIRIRDTHPEIDLAFVVVQCPCRKRRFAVFASGAGAHHVSEEYFKTNEDARAILDLFNNASLLKASRPKNNCESCVTNPMVSRSRSISTSSSRIWL